MIREIYNYVSLKSGTRSEEVFLQFLNAAVREVWNALDPILDEMFIKAEGPLVTLPWCVGELRAMKSVCLDEQMTLLTPRPYYASKIPTTLPFVTLNTATPLLRSIRTASTLTISRAIADVPITVTVHGATRNGSAAVHAVDLPIGAKKAELKIAFVTLTALVRNALDNCDTEIYDAEGTLISIIPMDRFEARYQQIRITDRRLEHTGSPECFAIYYRPVVPYYRRLDSPLDPRLVDMVQNKILEMIMTGSSNEHEANAAAIYGSKTKAAHGRYGQRSAGISTFINTGETAHDYQRVYRPGRGD